MKSFILVLVAAGLCACSLKRSADNMEKNTQQLKDTSDKLGKRTTDLEQELTFKESSLMMIMNLRYLFGEDDLPQTADALPNREPDLPFYAGVVIKSMWFQFWKGDYEENMAALDERLELGAEILFTRALTYTPHFANVDEMNPDRGWKAIASLGAKLDFLRPEYERVARAQGLSQPSFYDVVIEALRVRDQADPEVKFPRATAKILQYAQVVEYMVQLRHNYLPAMVLCSITDFKDRGTLSRAWMAYVSGAKVDLSVFKPAQLKEWTLWLRLAQQTREDLKKIGIEPQYNSTLRKVARSIDFGQRELLAMNADSLAGTPKLRREFAEAYMKLLQ